MKLKYIFIFIFCLLSSTLEAADYYVSPGGLDTNSGTIGSPFQTITKARDVIRTINTNMTGNINVYLRGGWYMLSSPVTFNQSDSGTNGFNIIYQAYTGEHPVISGGTQITGWSVHDSDKNVWKAPVPLGLNIRQLYTNCLRGIRAHKGNTTAWPLTGFVKNASGFTTTDSTMQNWGNRGEIEFIFNGLQEGVGSYSEWFRQWLERRAGVSYISGTTIVMDEPAWTRCGGPGTGNNSLNLPTDIENAYELLDEAGEWYLDSSESVLYYKPRLGEDLSTAEVIAPVLETLVAGAGVLGTPVHNIQFKGITFAHVTWLEPSTTKGFPEWQANATGYGYFPGGGVSFKAAQNIRFERCIFKHLGGEGLELSGGAQNCVVTGCVFTDISANPVRIGTFDDPVRSDTRARDSGNQVTNCYIHDAPNEFHGGCGITAVYVSSTVLSHNEIGYVSYTGISCGWGGWGTTGIANYMQNNQLTYNYIHHFCQYQGDGGGIYTLNNQPNSKWHNNWFDNMPYRTAGGAVYPDDSSAYIEIYNNVCSNISNLWLQVWVNRIHDINIHNNWTTTLTQVQNGTNITMSNNTLISGSIGSWPAAAQSIAYSAGIESAYSDIKTLQCACSYGMVEIIDTTPPNPPSAVRDGTGVDTESTKLTTQLSANWDVASDPESSISRYDYAIGTAPGATNITNGWISNGTNLTVTKTGLMLTIGTTYYFSVKSINRATPQLESSARNSNGQIVTDNRISIPGKIEAEDYKEGGEGAGYHDTTTGNTGGAYKNDGVDIEACEDTGGGYNIGWVAGGEWLAYDVTVANSGTYNIILRLASPLATGRMHVEVDGVDKTGTITVPNTGAYQSYTDVISTGINLSSGNHELRVVFDVAGENLNYIIISTGAEIIVPVDTFLNGSFENDFNSWTLTPSNGAAAGIGAGEGVYDGVKACIFNSANVAGNAVLQQTFHGAAGSMELSFYLGAFGAATQQQLKVEVMVGGVAVFSPTISITGPGNWTSPAVFEKYTYPFTGDGGNITLRFTDLTTLSGSNACDSVLDNISITNIVDTTPPSPPGTVRDGTSTADISSTTLTIQLSANWTAATDGESGISNYQYAIGTAQGTTDITNGWISNGTNLIVTKPGLSLVIDTTYYFSVKAVNGAGLHGSAANSNGQVVLSTSVPDTTPPSAPGTVKDGDIEGTDDSFTYSTTTLSANWALATDSESGIANYQYAIGTTSGGTNVVPWTSLGNVLTVRKTGLTLTIGTTYYFSVKAINSFSLIGSAANSDGQYVGVINPGDTTAPSAPLVVRDGLEITDAVSTYDRTELSANWAVSIDTESGISRYWYSVGSSQGGTNIVIWTDNGPFTSVTKTGLNLTAGTTYYFSVKAENGVGLQSSTTTSNGQYVVPGPVPPVISNVHVTNINENSVTITWTTNKLTTSQVEYGVTAIYGQQSTVDSGLVTSHSVNLTGLTANSTYHYRVISRDQDDNEKKTGDFTFNTLPIVLPMPGKAHPNPVDFRQAGAKVTFDVNNAAGEVKIYTLTGKLVKNLAVGSGIAEIQWDGKNEAGQKVVRGIYVYRIKTAAGNTIGRLAVVR